MNTKSDINMQNKITATFDKSLTYSHSYLKLDYNTRIGVSHLLDLTSTIEIGTNSMLAGSGSQIWTHSFYFSKQGEKVIRIDGAVKIGKNCYIGSRCVICAGVEIANAITVGANTCVSKGLKRSGMYASQPVRFIQFDPDLAEEKLGSPVANSNGVNIYKK